MNHYRRESLAVAQRILIELVRRRRSLILWLVFPLSLLAINGLVISERLQMSLGETLSLVAPSALVGAALFFSCLGGTVATIVAEREQLTLKRLFLSPLSGLSYFSGIFIAHSCVGFGQAILVYLGSALWGGRFAGNLFLGAAILLLTIISYVAMGFILGTQLARRTEDVNSIVAAFGIPLLILGGAFFPTQFFPKLLLQLAEFNPVYHMNEALVGVSKNGDSLEKIASHFSFLCGFAAATSILAWLAYNRMLDREKRL
jgi:ABC-2 type transport system permease protein